MNYRGYIISNDNFSPTLVRVAVEGQGGSVPKELTGLFTHPGEVKKMIDNYLDTKKGKPNGKTAAKRGDQDIFGGSED